MAETTPLELTRAMLGREMNGEARLGKPAGETVVLQVDALHVRNDRRTMAVRGVSLDVRQGEILGIAGVAGNGQRELAEAIVGLRPVAEGEVKLKEWSSPANRRRR